MNIINQVIFKLSYNGVMNGANKRKNIEFFLV